MNISDVVASLENGDILSETYAWYDLFYGNFGIVTRNITEEAAANMTQPV